MSFENTTCEKMTILPQFIMLTFDTINCSMYETSKIWLCWNVSVQVLKSDWPSMFVTKRSFDHCF